MKVYVQGEKSLIPIQEEVTAESIEEALGYTPADEDVLESHKTDASHITDAERESWNNKPDLESIDESDDSTLYVTDKDGNIITKTDGDGFHAAEVYIRYENGEKTVSEMISEAVADLDVDVDFTECDPTVPDWAKQPIKPTYTAEEVGALPNTTPIPDVSGKLETSTFENHEADLDKHLGGDISTKNDEALYICDKDGNIIARFDGDGLDITDLKIGSIPFTDHVEALVEGETPCTHEYVTIQELVHNTTDCTTWRDLQYCNSCGKVHANRLHTTHSFTSREIMVQPTCITGGIWKRACSRCDKVETIPMPALGHIEGDEWIIDTEPTYLVEGSKHTVCTVCGATVRVEAIPKLEPESDGTFAYKLLDDGTYSVQADNTSISGEITIPSEYNGKAVTTIARDAFYKCSDITNVVIPNSVTYIGDDAFYYCSNLTSVVIGDSVTSIGKYAFSNCSNLTSVVIGDSVTSIDNSAFSYCSSLESVTIPESVTSIGNSAFSYCKGLTSVTIGNGVTSIGSCAFYNCSNLTSIVIPDSVTSIGEEAFYYCTSLVSVTIPDSVTSIGEQAFYNCEAITHAYYEGTETEWNNIDGGLNEDLTDNLYYYSENAPTTTGNFWHYVDDVPTVWVAETYNLDVEFTRKTYTHPGSGQLYTGEVGAFNVIIPTEISSVETLEIRLYATYTKSGYFKLSLGTYANATCNLVATDSTNGIYTLTISGATGDVSITIDGAL